MFSLATIQKVNNQAARLRQQNAEEEKTQARRRLEKAIAVLHMIGLPSGAEGVGR